MAAKKTFLIRSHIRSLSRDSAITSALLRWFRTAARDLPWRRTLDPYAIWVSEIMLQQTQVKTVIPYWERWMRELPGVRALASLDRDRLLKLWEGLGYYTRARNLQKAARQIVDQHQGQFPKTYAEILALPGVGRYTAGAICSLAYNQPTALLDGNVVRVLTRLDAVSEDPRERKTNEGLWERAQALVEEANSLSPSHSPQLAGNCSSLNQSLMELGATICTPRSPDCAQCPLKILCKARALDRVEDFPRLPKREKPTPRRFHAFVIEQRGSIWVRRRPEGIVNAGLWEFPNVEVMGDSAKKPEETLLEHLGLERATLDPIATVRHSITRYRIELKAYYGVMKPSEKLRSGTEGSATMQQVTAEEATALAFTSAHARVLKAWIGRREGQR